MSTDVEEKRGQNMGHLGLIATGDKSMQQLDDLELIRQLDTMNLLKGLHEFPQQLRSSWQNTAAFQLPRHYRDVDNIVILGMGNSAAGADLIRSLLCEQIAKPLLVHRDYKLPKFVNDRSLVIASSYSGDTEETVAGLEEAIARDCKVIGISTGGKLAQKMRSTNLPLLLYSYHSHPRAALGYAIVPLLAIFEKLGFLPEYAAEMLEAASEMTSLAENIKETIPTSENIAKQLASRLHDRLPLIYGSGIMSEVARRWKTQFNETAKTFAAFEQLPEVNHNGLAGYEFAASVKSQITVIFLTSRYDHPRNTTRIKLTQQVLERQGIAYEIVAARGTGRFAQMMTNVLLGDYTGYYLALLNGVNPHPADNIDSLKEELEQL